MQDREKAFIKTLAQSKSTFGIGDDGVLLGDFVVANDAFFEGVHFKREWGSLESLIQKSFLVNLSDIYAMNAIPKYALLTLCIPKDFKEARELARVFSRVAEKFGVKIVGGDTIVGEKLQIALTILGEKQKKTLFRKKIQKGDFLAYLSPRSPLNLAPKQAFGKNLRALKYALRFNQISKNSRFECPLVYPKMIFAFNDIAKAGMDISDGIFVELGRLGQINKVDFELLKSKGEWFYSPEEYQMLYALSAKNLKKAQNLAKKFRHHLVIFARAKRGKYQSLKKNWHC